jgi:hypothetical protein
MWLLAPLALVLGLLVAAIDRYYRARFRPRLENIREASELKELKTLSKLAHAAEANALCAVSLVVLTQSRENAFGASLDKRV